MDVRARCPQWRGHIRETAQWNHVDVPKVNWLGFLVSRRFLGTAHAKKLRNSFIHGHIHILLINTILMIYICYILWCGMREMCVLAVFNSKHDMAWETRMHCQRLPGGRCVIREELQVNVITWMLSDEPAPGSREAGGFLGTTHAKTLRNLFICSHIHILLINTILMIYIYYIL